MEWVIPIIILVILVSVGRKDIPVEQDQEKKDE
jgi:hypothetical protein